MLAEPTGAARNERGSNGRKTLAAAAPEANNLRAATLQVALRDTTAFAPPDRSGDSVTSAAREWQGN